MDDMDMYGYTPESIDYLIDNWCNEGEPEDEDED